ncbi:AAA family ATPase [Jatrophihabitans sp. YIM 134969]
MARLILLNGAPGVGKSTVARELADARSLSLMLDLDVVRSLLGDTDGDVTASYLATRRLALAMAERHLRDGHDVVVPQYLGRVDFIEQLGSLCTATDSEFVEVALVTDAAVGQERFTARGDVPQLVGADESWPAMHARFTDLLAGRRHVHLVDASADVGVTVERVEQALRAGADGSG